MATTAAAIRTAMINAIQALAPTSMSDDGFKLYREDVIPFDQWAVQNPQASFRWFSVLDSGERTPPAVISGNAELEHVTFELAVAYPHTNRYGADAGRDMEDVIDEDQRKIDHAVGPFGSAAFSIDATPLVVEGQSPRWSRINVQQSVILVGTLAFKFWRTAP